ncbi:MAG: glutamine--tRNA ligase/YqeY domain fusion protein, partial [Zetaproteobacteria bacterium]|nr:glutamine--tRNA ligase/YqeY domain fusion protein [Zetaproteobacteria bacterium]
MSKETSVEAADNLKRNFVKNIIRADVAAGKYGGKVVTRFPPEPNGFLHIGHAKALCLNFGIAEEFAGAVCHLRFDDTNPGKGSYDLYMDAIKENINWLGFDWFGQVRFASDYFEQLYDYAVELIKMGKAYVCDLSAEEIKAYRGTMTEPGKESPYRQRSVAENLELFTQMRAGKFADGACLLRAKIDMAAGNINMRDPAIYRIRHASHPRFGDKWCIYPMYDYAHCMSDYIEGITHSLCSLEFQDHRPLYDWFVDQLTSGARPYQFEYSRLNLNYTVMSKRWLKQLVDEGQVSGWDDPRMPTIAGLKRRGYTPASLRAFSERIGVSKKETIIDYSILEECVRDDLNQHARRAMCVLQPIKLVIENYPEDQIEVLSAPVHPQNPEMGRRELSFSRELYIEADDFREQAPPKYHRLSPGKEVRLRNSYVVKCESFVKDASGQVTEVRCSYDPQTLGKKPEGRKVKGIIHWVNAQDALPVAVALYDRLFVDENPQRVAKEREVPLSSLVNPDSCQQVTTAMVEASLATVRAGDHFQFERLGYFVCDRAEGE